MNDYRHALRCALLALDEDSLRAEVARILEDMEQDHQDALDVAAIEEAAETLRLGERARAIAPTLQWGQMCSEFTGVLFPFDGEKESYIWVNNGTFGFACGGLRWRYNIGHIREPHRRARVLAIKARDYLARRAKVSRPGPSLAQTMEFRERSVRKLLEATKWSLEER